MMTDKELDNIRQTYNELDNAVINLPNRIEEVATGFVNEFLTTYRIHIISIQEEMKVLKEKIKIAQEALNDNEVVSKLEDVVHWFRNQADQFQHLHEEMVEEAQMTAERTQQLSIKNDELRRQLMVLVKTNKILKMKSLSNLSLVDESSSSYANNIEDDSILSFVNDNNNSYDRSDNNNDNDNDNQIYNSELEPACDNNQSNANYMTSSNSNYDNADDYNTHQSYTQNCNNKKKTTSAARNRSNQVLAELNQLRQSRSSTEIVLDDALTQATIKITQRKQLQSLSSSTSALPTKKSMRSTTNSTDKLRQSTSSLLPPLSSSSHNNNNNNNNNTSSGISGYSLKSSTEQDKYEVMVYFLSNPQQFVKVIQRYQEWSAQSIEQQQLLLQQEQEDNY